MAASTAGLVRRQPVVLALFLLVGAASVVGARVDGGTTGTAVAGGLGVSMLDVLAFGGIARLAARDDRGTDRSLVAELWVVARRLPGMVVLGVALVFPVLVVAVVVAVVLGALAIPVLLLLQATVAVVVVGIAADEEGAITGFVRGLGLVRTAFGPIVLFTAVFGGIALVVNYTVVGLTGPTSYVGFLAAGVTQGLYVLAIARLYVTSAPTWSRDTTVSDDWSEDDPWDD